MNEDDQARFNELADKFDLSPEAKNAFEKFVENVMDEHFQQGVMQALESD